jgi:tRNA(fMet)-specific endonuclease VapC
MSARPALLDTNVASYLFGKKPQAALYEHALRGRHAALSFQTAAELLAGADMKGWGAQRRRALKRYLDDAMIVYPNRATLQTWSHLRAALAKKGLVVDTADMWVAATALDLDLTLFAHDAVFRQIAGLKLVCHAP